MKLTSLALAFAVSASFASVGCTTQGPDDDLVFESDTAKADIVRPVGVYRRDLAPGEDGFRILRLNEDRSYSSDAGGGTYRFASSHGKRYVVLSNAGEVVDSFEYKLTDDSLELRASGTSEWFTMTHAASLELDSTDDGGSFDVEEGGDVVLRLPSNGSTGYRWKVTSTDRTFGYPTESFQATGIVPGPVGGGGTLTLTWATFGGPLSYAGEHHVKLEYRRDWESTSTPAADTYEFTVNVAD